MSKQSFFEKYAHEYDALTNAAERAGKHRQEVAALIERFRPSAVLDAGCATGLTSSLFAEAGVESLGLDRSRAMLTAARRKFAATTLPLSFRYGRFEALPGSLDLRFELVVCLANSISGVGTLANLRKALGGFRRVLRPGGVLVLQLRNIDAIRPGEIMSVRGTQQDGILYLRFMERQGSRTILYVVRADLNQQPVSSELFQSESENFSRAQIARALKAAGFRRISAYADLFCLAPVMRRSPDLVMVAHRPGDSR